MKKVLIFIAIGTTLAILGVMSVQDKDVVTSPRVEVVSEWEDGIVKEDRRYLKDDVIEITTYFNNFKVNTKGRVKIIGEEEIRFGEWVSFYKNGTSWSLCEYSNGVSDGIYKTWHPNGKPNIVGYYSNGVETGAWSFFDKSGIIVKEYDVTPGK